MDPELLERITARRAELDEREELLAKELAEVRAERNDLAVAERVLERVSEQLADERASAAPAPGQVGGRAVMLIPHRTPEMEETTMERAEWVHGIVRAMSCTPGRCHPLLRALARRRCRPVCRPSRRTASTEW